jgi:predicted negative regulator of RcsB-dependent stress response
VLVGGVLAWQVWQDKKAIRRLHHKVAQSDNLASQLETLQAEQQALAAELSQLQTQNGKPVDTKSTTGFNATAQTTEKSSKLSMLKRLVEENVNLRRNFS